MARKSYSHRKRLGYLSKTVFTANLFAVVALLLSYGAAFINPQIFWPLAFFGLGYLPILLINCGFIVYWFLRRKRYMLLSLVTILVGYPFLNKHINFKNKNDRILVKTDSVLRVMSFNVHLFQRNDNGKNFRGETTEFIRTITPDIICFQEFYSRIRGSKQFTKTLKEEGDFEDYYFEPFEKNDYEGYGQAIFSKYPIINKGTITQHSFGVNRIIYADIKREFDTLRVYNVHLRSFALQDEDKAFIQQPPSEQVKDEKKTLKLGRKLKRAFTNRSEQAKTLLDHIQHHCPYSYVVMGDFNDTPMSYSVNLVSKNMNNAFAEKGFGWGVTHFGILPIFQIDYILCDKRIQIDDFGILKERLSDHYPIWADLLF